MSLAPPRGTRDLLHENGGQFQFIVDMAFKIALGYGYSPAFTPIFEQYGVFSRSAGETSDIVNKEMYFLESRSESHQKEKLVLRPEGTAPIVRALISNGLTQTLPQKFVYAGPMFRYERPQKGRYRQFHQVGVEHFGAKTPLSDAESISLAARILKHMGVEATLHINTLGQSETRHAYTKALVTYLKPHQHQLSYESQERLKNNPMRILDSKSPQDHIVLKDAPTLNDFLSKGDQDNFKQLCNYLNDLSIAYIIDTKLVRGLDYYTGTVFEFKCADLGAQDAILAGGRYDGLTEELGGPSIPAIGWAMGVDRVMIAMKKNFQEPSTLALITVGNFTRETLKIAEALRDTELNVLSIEQTSIPKALKIADRLKACFALIYGENEHNQGIITIKPLNKNHTSMIKDQTINLSQLSEFCHALTQTS